MKFIDMIVDFILGENQNKGSNKVETEKATPVYLPCSEIFGGLSKNDNSAFLNYDYVSADFKPENKITI